MNPIKTIQEAVNNVLEEFIEQEEKHTLDDLKQKLINELYDIPVANYEMKDIEILKVLFN